MRERERIFHHLKLCLYDNGAYHVKCIQPPRAKSYRNLHFGQSMPFNLRCLETVSELTSGSFASFHSANFSHVNPSCCCSHYIWRTIERRGGKEHNKKLQQTTRTHTKKYNNKKKQERQSFLTVFVMIKLF